MTENSNIERKCERCGAALTADAPEGLCPRCLMALNLATQTEVPGAEVGPGGTRVIPPGQEPAPPSEDIARQFPQLEILECLGRGGMGVVYKARQPRLDRFVALKILAREKEKDPRFAERFTREARALARLNHPNIVTVYDFGETNGLYYLLMEFVDGMSLRQLLESRKLPPEEALTIVPPICEALQYAHQLGIVHRDIKPENILLDKQGRVKIADFGIAKLVGADGRVKSLTGEQGVVGTPHYMAPEQVEKPSTVDHRADIYSLGVVFYEMLTGELPLGRFAPPSRKVQIDVRLDEVVLHALEKEPALRYQQASQVKTAVETIAHSESRGPKSEETGARPDADALAQQILARDYALDIGSCLRRGWTLVRSDFWLLVGATALILMLMAAAASIGEVSHSAGNLSYRTSVLSVLLGGPLMGGLYLCFLKKLRGERVRIETAFSGFSQSLLQLFLAGFVTQVLTVLGGVCLILPGVYLFVAWFFTLPLIIDKRLDFWPAMRLSRKTISIHWWKFLGFLLVLMLVNLVGIMALCVGVFVTIPVSLAALMYAYEDIFNPLGPSPASPAQSRIPGAEKGVPPDTAAPPPDLRSWLTVVLAGLLSFLLLTFAALTCLAGGRLGYCLASLVGALALAMLLFLRKSSLPQASLALLLLVFELVFGAAILITSILPDSFVSTARVMFEPNRAEAPPSPGPHTASATYDPHLVQTECELMQSEVILGSVIRALDLDQEWGKRYGKGQPLKTIEIMSLLKSRMDVRPVGKTSLIAIGIYGEQPDEAARIANEIAQAYASHNSLGPLRVEIVDRALPALSPSRPNKPLNLAVGALLGLLLGTVAGGTRIVLGGTKESA